MIMMFIGSHGQTINPSPENTFVFMGNDARFDCTINDITNGQVWYKIKDGVAIGIAFDGSITASEGTKKYEIEGTYNLIILNTVFEDAMTYRCEYFADTSVHFNAQLFILGMFPSFIFHHTLFILYIALTNY